MCILIFYFFDAQINVSCAFVNRVPLKFGIGLFFLKSHRLISSNLNFEYEYPESKNIVISTYHT